MTIGLGGGLDNLAIVDLACMGRKVSPDTFSAPSLVLNNLTNPFSPDSKLAKLLSVQQ